MITDQTRFRPVHLGSFALPALLLLADPVGVAGQLPMPNPYVEVDSSFGQLPEGRSWGAISAVYPAPDGASIWVADRCGRQGCVGREDWAMIFRFDLEGQQIAAFGEGTIALPHGMTVDAEGNVWVADAANFGELASTEVGHVVRKFSPDGEVLLTLGVWGQPGSGRTHFTKPSDVIVAPNGDVFVADGHDDFGNNRIVKFDAAGNYLMEWGTTGGDTGEFREPHALAMDSRGRLFVGDRGNHRIQIFDQQGTHLATWTQFGSPSGMYIDSNDILYVADSDSNASRNPGWRRGIYIGSAQTGWVSGFIPDPEPNPDDLVTSAAEGVAVDREGNLYGGEVGPRTLRKYRLRR